jgi:L-lactate dehydrogenase complex protein LldG
MTGDRERILSQVRRSLRRREPLEQTIADSLDERIASHRRHVMPTVDGSLLDRLQEKIELAAGSVHRVESVDDISSAVVDYLVANGLPMRILATSDALVGNVRWSNELAVEQRRALADDEVSVTATYGAIAETGTLALLSDPTTPTTLNFLPETHVAILRSSRIVAHIEDIFAMLRSEYDTPPRTVNFISGPSRTGDVELQIELGAHGPKRLHVIIIVDD